jgi:hypothetical protein
VHVKIPQFGGGIENIQFLSGESPTVGDKTQLRENAQTAVVYATFWIEKATHKRNSHSFMQLQYAQMVVLPRIPSASSIAPCVCELRVAAHIGGDAQEEL